MLPTSHCISPVLLPMSYSTSPVLLPVSHCSSPVAYFTSHLPYFTTCLTLLPMSPTKTHNFMSCVVEAKMGLQHAEFLPNTQIPHKRHPITNSAPPHWKRLVTQKTSAQLTRSTRYPVRTWRTVACICLILKIKTHSSGGGVHPTATVPTHRHRHHSVDVGQEDRHPDT